MNKHEILPLQLFAEGGEGASAEAGAEGETAQQPETVLSAPEGKTAEERILALEEQLSALLEQQKKGEAPSEPDAALVQQHWQGVEQIYRALEAQAEELKQLYPDFDLRAECADMRFARMLRAGVDMGAAYQALHAAEILPAAMEYAARTVQQRLASSLGSGADRPRENGLHSGGAVMVGSQISKMTRQDYARICRMVERGERVSFG